MGSGSNSSEFSIPDAQFSKCGFVCDPIQSQTPIICLSSTRQQSTSDICSVHGLESSSCICFSSSFSDSCCSGKNPTTSMQNSSHSSVLATTTVVLRTTSSISVSSDSSATNSKTLDTIKRKICSSKPPTSQPSHLGVIKQSEIKNFLKTLRILSLDQEEHLHKKSTMQNGPSSLIGVIQKRLIRSRPLLQLYSRFLNLSFHGKEMPNQYY